MVPDDTSGELMLQCKVALTRVQSLIVIGDSSIQRT